MSEQTIYIFQLTSAFSVILPLCLGLWKFAGADRMVKGFIIYLFLGLTTDLAGWYFYLSKDGTSNLYVRHAYDLIESVFFFWFLSRVTPSRLVGRFFLLSIPILIPFWALRFLNLDAMAIYVSTAQVVIAFGACFSLIQMVEIRKEVADQVIFWLLLGIFFYCFSTFFFMGVLASKLAKIWYAHNIINTLTNVIYFIGFFKAKNFIASIKNNE